MSLGTDFEKGYKAAFEERWNKKCLTCIDRMSGDDPELALVRFRHQKNVCSSCLHVWNDARWKKVNHWIREAESLDENNRRRDAVLATKEKRRACRT
jgi:hypothetical protein